MQLSVIETERLLAQMVADELRKRRTQGTYSGLWLEACCLHSWQLLAQENFPPFFTTSVTKAALRCRLASIPAWVRHMDLWQVGYALCSSMLL